MKNQNYNLSLNPICIKEDYKKEWRISESDFMLLCNNGVPLSNTLYRVGGLNNPNYFMLLKHIEARWEDKILKQCKDKYPKHLDSRWCIIDNKGTEKVIFDTYNHGYLVKGSCIYHIGSKYYNIETGEFYGYSPSSMESSTRLYLDTKYDRDKNKRGVLVIDKLTGTSELMR
jgi:hypothetical protein